MFEIYREDQNDARHRVIYYTELDDHNREKEINRALAGESLFAGYLRGSRLAEAKLEIHRWLKRLDHGESFRTQVFENALDAFLTR